MTGLTNIGKPVSAAERSARMRMLTMRGWKRVGEKWQSPYTGCCYDTRAALDIEIFRGNWAKKMRAAWI